MNKFFAFIISSAVGLLLFIALIFSSPSVADSLLGMVEGVRDMARAIMLLSIPFVLIGTIWGMVSIVKNVMASMGAGPATGQELFEEEDNRWVKTQQGNQEWIETMMATSPYLKNRFHRELVRFHTLGPVILGAQRVVVLGAIIVLLEVFVNIFALGLTPGDSVRYMLGVYNG